MKASVRWYEQRKGKNKGGGEKHTLNTGLKKGRGTGTEKKPPYGCIQHKTLCAVRG